MPHSDSKHLFLYCQKEGLKKSSFFCKKDLTNSQKYDIMAGRAEPARPEFSIIAPSAFFVNSFFKKILYKIFPKFLVIFTIDFFKIFCYNKFTK
jgi:hypothetical protein